MKKITSVLASTILLASGVLAAFSGCGGDSDPNTIRYVAYTGGGALDDSYRIVKKVDEYVYEKLGFHVDIEYIGYNTYAKDLKMYLSTGEDFDMCYSGSLLSGLTYSTAVSDGYFADITDELKEHAPKLNEFMSGKYGDAAKIDGKIYGVINEQMFARSVGVAIDREIAAELGLTQEKIDEEGLTYADVIRTAMNYIQSDPDISPEGKVPSTTLVLGNAWDDIIMQNYGLDALGMDSYSPGVIEAADGKTTVVNQYESKYFKEFADFCRECHENGWIDSKQAQLPVTSNQRVRLVGTYYPDVAESTLYSSIGREFEIFQFGTPLLSTVNVTSSMTAINATSTKVDKCLQFLELLHSDQYLYNLLAIGEVDLEYQMKTGYLDDGTEYEYVSYIKTSKYKPMADWAFGPELNTYRKRGYAENWADVVRDINANAYVSPAYGFTFIPDSSLSGKLNNCYITVSRYMDGFVNGTYQENMTNEQIIAEMNNKIKDYVDDIVSAKQAQLDAFLAKK